MTARGGHVGGSRRVLVTGAASFIGMHVAEALLACGDEVVGVDDLNGYYDVALKQARPARLRQLCGFQFRQIDIADTEATLATFAARPIDRAVHLAAQAGVRHSLTHPHAYAQANLVGFLNVLEGCPHHHGIDHLVYASSSSVYGGNRKMPFADSDPVDHPVSLYAATKKANLIPVFNHGRMSRDFTYIDDSLVAVLDTPPNSGEDGGVPCGVLNIGSHAPVPLLTFIGALEHSLGHAARLDLLPMQPGDVPATYADVDALQAVTGARRACVPLEEGVRRFVEWYRAYQGVASRTASGQLVAAVDA